MAEDVFISNSYWYYMIVVIFYDYGARACIVSRNRNRSGKNLLVTFETLRNPLDMKMVEGMLKEFIL